MNAVFADTFYWIALTNSQDLSHERARSFAPVVLFTSEEVLTEYLNYFAAWGPNLRRKACMNVQTMRGNPTVQIIPQTPTSFSAGVDLYQARLDKGYSLTDCISMAAMRRYSITDVLTNDAHFEQEGFRALFRQS
jgi:predicted nucleic acid-binding protein